MAHKTQPDWKNKDWCENSQCLCDVKQFMATIPNIGWSLKEIAESLRVMSGRPESQPPQRKPQAEKLW